MAAVVTSKQNQKLAEDSQSGDSSNLRLKEIARDLIVNGSIEIRNISPGRLQQGRELLPYGIRVYIRSLHNQNPETSLENISLLARTGFDPVPHIAARWIRSRNELRDFLTEAVRLHGVSRILLIGGDIDEVMGPYTDAKTVLQDGVLETTGIREIGFAAYPEGHALIPKEVLSTALAEKLQLAASNGFGSYIITQFSFVPSRIVDFCALMSRNNPDTSIYVGIAGPTDPDNLTRYANICSVSASIRALTEQGFKAAKLISHTDPGAQLETVARYCAARETCNVTGIHVFSFGGFIKSSQWMHRVYSN